MRGNKRLAVTIMKNCIWCDKALEGRADKKYCSSYCRTAYHNQKTKDLHEPSVFRRVDKQLHKKPQNPKRIQQSREDNGRPTNIDKTGFLTKILHPLLARPKQKSIPLLL
jgi:hypothetical protein